MIDKGTLEKLKPFTFHGVHFNGASGDNAYGDCPFCGKEGKFYVNYSKLLWDCKVCHAKGGLFSFLSQVAKSNAANLTKDALDKLCINRGLPASAFENLGVGWNGQSYTIPVRNEKGLVHDIRNFKIGSKILGTGGCKVGLIGLDKLIKNETDIVYICEGEWDFIALRWLLKKLNRPEAVVGVPGANTFKQDWVKYFVDKHVRVVYDHDPAGEDGELGVKVKLQGVVKSIQFLHWPSALPNGFDIRDFVVKEAIKKQKPKATLSGILSMLRPTTRKRENNKVDAEEVGQSLASETANIKPRTLAEVHAVYKKWLKMENTDVIDVMLASHISNCFSGESSWLFLVAPPGGSKTEILNGLSLCSDVHMTSSITSKTLISGTIAKDGRDLSLIPRLKDKTLIIKDFTTILSKRDNEKDEIFGDLRDAYDQRCGKTFGNGVERHYEVKFNIIAGVTTDIYAATSQYKSLGERFQCYKIGDNLEHEGEDDMCLKAVSNYSKEEEMRKEISEVVAGFVMALKKEIKDKGITRIAISHEMTLKLVKLARFGARARAAILRDNYDYDNVLSKPSAEVATRLSKQNMGIMQRLGVVRSRNEVTKAEYEVMKKIMRDTIPQKTDDMLKALWKACPTEDDSISTVALGDIVKYPPSTVSRMLKDLRMLDMVIQLGDKNRREWNLSKYMRTLIKESGVYDNV